MTERWATRVDGQGVATLDIPADAQHDRTFEIYCRFVVSCPQPGQAAHGMRVTADGAQQWSRRVTTATRSDTLDYRFRRTVPAGQPLRLVVTTDTRGCQSELIEIEAEQETG